MTMVMVTSVSNVIDNTTNKRDIESQRFPSNLSNCVEITIRVE